MNCNKTKIEKNNQQNYLTENRFILTQYKKFIDSIENNFPKNDSMHIIEFPDSRKININYSMGAIHFLVANENESYYVINDLSPYSNWCGWESNDKESIKNDSLIYIKRNIDKVKKAELINNQEITKILEKYKDSIVNKMNPNPLSVSFAFEKDTLKGKTMYNTINYMEKNGMKSYFFRKMNTEEIYKVKK